MEALLMPLMAGRLNSSRDVHSQRCGPAADQLAVASRLPTPLSGR